MTIQLYALIGAPIVAVLGLLVSGERNWRVHVIAVLLALAMTGVVCAIAPARLWVESPFLFGGAIAWGVTDTRTGFIRNKLTMPLAILLIILGVIDHGWLTTLAAVVAIAGILAFFRWFLTGPNKDGDRIPGSGGGDVVVGICFAAGLGWSGGLSALIVAMALCIGYVFLTAGPGAFKKRLRVRLGAYFTIGVFFGALYPFLPQLG